MRRLRRAGSDLGGLACGFVRTTARPRGGGRTASRSPPDARLAASPAMGTAWALRRLAIRASTGASTRSPDRVPPTAAHDVRRRTGRPPRPRTPRVSRIGHQGGGRRRGNARPQACTGRTRSARVSAPPRCSDRSFSPVLSDPRKLPRSVLQEPMPLRSKGSSGAVGGRRSAAISAALWRESAAKCYFNCTYQTAGS